MHIKWRGKDQCLSFQYSLIILRLKQRLHSVKENEPFSCKNGNFVEAVYDSKFYIGKLIEYDDTDYYVDYCAYWESFEAVLVPLAKKTGQNMSQSWLNSH